METKFKIAANWNELKSKFKQYYSGLSDEDLSYSLGKEDELLSRLSKKLGKNEKEMRNIIDDLLLKDQPINAVNKVKKSVRTEYREKWEEDIERERDEQLQMESQEEISKGY